MISGGEKGRRERVGRGGGVLGKGRGERGVGSGGGE